MASPHGRVNSSSPRVASEDSAKPNERASHGSTTSTTTIAAPSTGGPAERRDRLSPIRPIAPITAARTTLGSGRASTTNPASADQGQHRSQPSRHADQDAQPEDQPGDDGDVAAAHGGQVGHAGRPHGSGEVGRGAAGVADDQAGQQPPRRRRVRGRPRPAGRCAAARPPRPPPPAAPGPPAARSPTGSRPGRRPARWARAGRAPAPWRATPGSAIAGSPVSSTGAPVPRRMPARVEHA